MEMFTGTQNQAGEAATGSGTTDAQTKDEALSTVNFFFSQ